MKVLTIVVRILLGLIFFVLGLNGFLNFLHGGLPGGLAGDFLRILMQSHYLYLVAGVQVLSGALLLIDRYVPLALVLAGALIANILTYHATLEPGKAQLAIAVAILWLFLAWRFRGYLAPLFVAKTERATREKIAV